MTILTKDSVQLKEYLDSIHFLQSDEAITAVSVPGDGNMNFTLRVNTNQRSFIIKQSRSYVEKYPQVAAPAKRAMQEHKFYTTIANDAHLALRIPAILSADAEHNVLIMQDLGEGTPYVSYYQTHEQISIGDLDILVDFLIHLHGNHKLSDAHDRLSNIAMRQLNHEHMYVYPLSHDNGLNLDDISPGLQDYATELRSNKLLVNNMTELGKIYLSDGDTLLHGDYFLGSWLRIVDDIYVIDPEFGHHGTKEFELGVMLAHLMMAQQPEHYIDHCIHRYTQSISIHIDLVMAFAGGEIIRRLCGLAQLPLSATLHQRQVLLDRAQDMVLNLS